MHNKPLKVLFILLFSFPFIDAIGNEYDNSQIIGDSQLETNITACIFEITEHFVLEKDNLSARMLISSSDIFQSILDQLDFLAQIQLLNSEETLDVNLCNPFLFIRSENSSVCKHGSKIRFSDEAC